MSSLNNLIMEIQRPVNSTLILATAWIITQVYAKIGSGSTFIELYANSKSAQMEQNDLMEAILMQVEKSTTTTSFFLERIHSFQSSISHIMSNKIYKNKAIWFLDSWISFKHLLSHILDERNQYYRNGFFCIIYTGRETDRMSTIRAIFHQLFEVYVTNVNVLLPAAQVVYVYTYFPFSYKNCHNTEPIVYGTFGAVTNYEFSRKRFFPKKLLNMWRCKVKVTPWTVEPFLTIDYNKTTGDVIRLEGIEGKLLMKLAERMNFSIQIIEDPHHRIGNGTDPGVMKMLKDGQTDITIGLFRYDIERQKIALAAYSYLTVPVKLAISHGKMMAPLERLIHPFQYTVWIWFSSIVLLGIFVIFLVMSVGSQCVQEFVFGQGNLIPHTNFWNVIYGGPIAGRLPRRNFARYLLVVWLLYTFVLRSAYIAQLFLILRDSSLRNEVNTVDEAMKQNYTFYTYAVLEPTLVNVTKHKIDIKLLDYEPNAEEDLLKQLHEKEDIKIAIVSVEQIIRYYIENPKNRFYRVNVLKEPVMTLPVTFYMRKHSYLANEINELLWSIISAGLIHRIEDLSFIQQENTVEEIEAPTCIQLYDLTGLFFIYIAMSLLSILVFLVELWSSNSSIIRSVIDFFNI